MGSYSNLLMRNQRTSNYCKLVLGTGCWNGHPQWGWIKRSSWLFLRVNNRNRDIQRAIRNESRSIQSTFEILFETRREIHEKRFEMRNIRFGLTIHYWRDIHCVRKRNSLTDSSQLWWKNYREERQQVQKESLFWTHEHWKNGLKDLRIFWRKT